MPSTQALPDKLELSKIEAMLTTRWLGRSVNELWDTINSTNSRAMILASDGAANGTIVIAEEQTAGRGRSGRVWFSPAGSGLYISFLLRPKIQTITLPVITLITGVAVAQAIQRISGIRPGLKWVNDLILNGKKVAGILYEYQNNRPLHTIAAAVPAEKHGINEKPGNNKETVGATFGRGEVHLSPPPISDRDHKEKCTDELHTSTSALVIGIGLNLNHPPIKLPTDLEPKIGFLQSYLPADQQIIDRNHLVASVANELEQALDQMQSGNLQSLLDQWRAYSITLGEEIIAQLGDKQITGQALDITDTGELIVKTNSGNVKLCAGEVSIRKTTGSYM